MKELNGLLFAFLFPLIVSVQQSNLQQLNKVDGPVIVVSDTVNLGEIYLDELTDEHGKIQIKLINSGLRPLILRNVTGCCGTNVKDWPKAPILPGKEALIKVEFRTEPRPQRISRTVTIESNATNNKILKVSILGVVIERKGTNEIVL